MHSNINMENQKSKIKENMSNITNKVVIMSGKGGVGKSTLSVNFAYGLSMRGYKVGILDADLHGPNIPIMLGVEGEKLTDLSVPYKINENLCTTSLSFFLPSTDPIIWRGPQKMGAIMEILENVVWGKLDYLIIDLPPGTGDETLTIAQNVGVGTKAIVVTTPQDVALLDSRRSVKFSGLVNMELIGIIENMSGFICPECGEEVNIFKKGGAERMANELNVNFLGSIPMDKNIAEAGDNGKPYIQNESEASIRLNKIIDQILDKVK